MVNIVTSNKSNASTFEITISGFFHNLLAIIVIAWMSNGLFTYAIPFIPNYIRYFIFALWFSISIFKDKNFISKFLVQSWPLIFFIIYLVLISFIADLYFIRTYLSASVYLLMIYTIFLFYFNYKHIKFQKILVAFMSIEIIFVATNTYIALKNDPLIARILAAGIDRAESFSTLSSFKGLGGYAFFYSLVPVILLLVYMFFNHPKKKIVTLISAIALFIVLIQASYTIALLLTITFTFLMILVYFFKKFPINKYPFIPFFLLAIFIVIFSQNIIAPTLMKLSNITWIPEVVVIRLIELSNFLTFGSSTGTDLNSRMILYATSIETFFNNFFAGIVAPPNVLSMIGGHSSWLDTLAYFGILSIPLFIFFFMAYRYTKRHIPKKTKVFYNHYWLFFFILGAVNTLLFSSIFTIWFVFLPFCLMIFFGNENKSKADFL